MRQASLGRGARSNSARSWSRSREAIEARHEPGHGRRVGLADAVDVGADQDQAAGAALAVGGGEARLGAADLAGEGVALAALGLLQRVTVRLDREHKPSRVETHTARFRTYRQFKALPCTLIGSINVARLDPFKARYRFLRFDTVGVRF